MDKIETGELVEIVVHYLFSPFFFCLQQYLMVDIGLSLNTSHFTLDHTEKNVENLKN
jgi:hypothetical protein